MKYSAGGPGAQTKKGGKVLAEVIVLGGGFGGLAAAHDLI